MISCASVLVVYATKKGSTQAVAESIATTLVEQGYRVDVRAADDVQVLDAKTPTVRPALVAIFGGVVDPTKLRFPFNRLPATDARDWDAIRQFAEQAGRLFARTAEVVHT